VITRRTFLCGLTLGTLALPLAGEAQQPGKVFRVGWLQPSQPPSGAYANFRRAMRELGYREGETVTFDDRWAYGRFDRLPGLAEELARLNVDVIVAIGTGSVRAAKEATRTIPIVMGSGDDPIKGGFVASLNRPGGNVTGVSILAPEVSAKRLDILKQTLPGVITVGVLAYRSNPGTAEQIAAIEAAAASLKLTIHPGYVERPGGYVEPFTRFTSERADAVLVLTDTVLSADRAGIVRTAIKHRPPVFFDFRQGADAGGLVSYGIDNLDLYRQTARFVDKILKGAKPVDLPVEQPTKFELVINLKTAKALGLTIPQAILLRADHVIE
jgi:putative tryptophan/tyrosine transport system substrate-binding protein